MTKMNVYNLTEFDLSYKDRTIPPNGGFLEYDLSFVPDRDRYLEKMKILAFGELPKWWSFKQPKVAVATVADKPVKIEIPVSEKVVEDKKFVRQEDKRSRKE